MAKYYQAYDERYKQIHEKGFLWEETAESKVISDTIKKYGISETDRILDLGTGEGRDSIFLLSKGYNVTGIDCSPEGIETCKKLAESLGITHYDFRVADIVNDRLKGEKFDFIYSIAVLHMLCTDEDRKAFFDFIDYHLTDKGIALVSVLGDEVSEMVTDYENAFENGIRFHRGAGEEVMVAKTSFRMVTKEHFIAEILSSGMELREYFVRTDIPGFSSMMTAVISKGEKK